MVRVVATEDGRDNYHLGSSAGPAGGEPGPPVVEALTIVDGRARVSLAGLDADFKVAFATEQGAADEVGAAPKIVAEARGTHAGQPIEARITGGAPLDLLDPSKPWPVGCTWRTGRRRPP